MDTDPLLKPTECADWENQLASFKELRRTAVSFELYLELLVHPRTCESCHKTLVIWFDELIEERVEKAYCNAIARYMAKQSVDPDENFGENFPKRPRWGEF